MDHLPSPCLSSTSLPATLRRVVEAPRKAGAGGPAGPTAGWAFWTKVLWGNLQKTMDFIGESPGSHGFYHGFYYHAFWWVSCKNVPSNDVDVLCEVNLMMRSDDIIKMKIAWYDMRIHFIDDIFPASTQTWLAGEIIYTTYPRSKH